MLVAMAAMVVRIRADRRRLSEVNTRLGELLSGAEHLARTDPLTGLPNRRAFLERVTDEWPARAGPRTPSASPTSTSTTSSTSTTRAAIRPAMSFFAPPPRPSARRCARATWAARLGGDEFAVLFTDAGRAAIEPLAHRLLARMKALGDQHPGLDLGASIGMAWFDKAPGQPPKSYSNARTAPCTRPRPPESNRFTLWTG